MKRPEKNIEIISAQYLMGYKIRILFNDNTWQDVNFKSFLFAYDRGHYNKYRELKIFKKFKIEEGNIVWG